MNEELIRNLIEVYKSKGISPQRLLDNPLFQQLSIAEKVNLLRENKEFFSTTPQLQFKTTGLSALGGAIGSGLTFAGMSYPRWAKVVAKKGIGGIGSSLPLLGIAIGTGALAAALPSIISAYKDYKRDQETTQSISENKYLNAIVNRSISGGTSPEEALQVKATLGGVSNYVNSNLGGTDKQTLEKKYPKILLPHLFPPKPNKQK